MTFTEWFTQHLRVERYPMPGEIAKMTAGSHVLNVSDEYIGSCAAAALVNKVFYHWLPLNECVGEMGLNSLFGAMVILHEAEQLEQQVLLHCHAGANRSPMIAAAYHYMRTLTHQVRYYKHKPRIQFLDSAGNDTTYDESKERLNLLQYNCSQGLLPPLEKVETFLRILGLKLEETKDMAGSRGGLLTSLKHQLDLR